MRCEFRVTGVVAGLLAGLAIGGIGAFTPEGARADESEGAALLETWCGACHSQ